MSYREDRRASPSSTRVEGTTRVTAQSALWLWKQGARIIAPEVGLKPNGLARAWDGLWRVDIAAVTKSSVEVIEVKGSAEDLRREDLTTGKWVLDYRAMNINPWLAVNHDIQAQHFKDLPDSWGVLMVRKDSLRVFREPVDRVSLFTPDFTREYETLARVLTLQAFPTMMGKSNAQAIRAFASEGWDRPWRSWSPIGRRGKEPAIYTEEPGNIL